MTSEGCPNFNKCGAPLCPLDLASLKNGLWYPDEEICKKQPAPNWVKVQRKIAKKTVNEDKYFNYAMLSRNCQIRKGIVGIDPDKAEEPQLKKWFKAHPVKREWSEEEKVASREKFLENVLKTKQEEFDLTGQKK